MLPYPIQILIILVHHIMNPQVVVRSNKARSCVFSTVLQSIPSYCTFISIFGHRTSYMIHGFQETCVKLQRFFSRFPSVCLSGSLVSSGFLWFPLGSIQVLSYLKSSFVLSSRNSGKCVES